MVIAKRRSTVPVCKSQTFTCLDKRPAGLINTSTPTILPAIFSWYFSDKCLIVISFSFSFYIFLDLALNFHRDSMKMWECYCLVSYTSINRDHLSRVLPQQELFKYSRLLATNSLPSLKIRPQKPSRNQQAEWSRKCEKWLIKQTGDA